MQNLSIRHFNKWNLLIVAVLLLLVGVFMFRARQFRVDQINQRMDTAELENMGAAYFTALLYGKDDQLRGLSQHGPTGCPSDLRRTYFEDREAFNEIVLDQVGFVPVMMIQEDRYALLRIVVGEPAAHSQNAISLHDGYDLDLHKNLKGRWYTCGRLIDG